jgi:hypothetical protein
MRDWMRRLSDTKQGLLVSLTLGAIVFGFLLLIELVI